MCVCMCAVLRPYKYAGYPMLITTIERESNDDDLFSKSAAILTAASEVAFHTMNTSSLNAEELRRDNGILVGFSSRWAGHVGTGSRWVSVVGGRGT